MDRWAPQSLNDLVALTATIRTHVQDGLVGIEAVPLWPEWRFSLAAQLAGAVSNDWLADSLAQTIVWGELAARLAAESAAEGSGDASPGPKGQPTTTSDFLSLLRRRLRSLLPVLNILPFVELVERVQQVDFAPIVQELCGAVSGEPVIHGYEHFLAKHDRTSRSQAGVYYTPMPVASFVVRSVHTELQRRFGLAAGLADTTTWKTLDYSRAMVPTHPPIAGDRPFVRILDPACGTGMFLVAVIDQIHNALLAAWNQEGMAGTEIAERWETYVRRFLLPRLVGFELMMAPWAIAHAAVAAALARTGYPLSDTDVIQLYQTNTLADPVTTQRDPILKETTMRLGPRIGDHLGYDEPFTVVLGNPPFSGISANRNRWIEDLLRGRGSHSARGRSYYEIDGRVLGEKKVWLSDDYVKFFRYAQWRIDSSGCGVVGLVTNHGYLDNPTFRGMRRSLMQTFSDITVLDLHGNVKKRDRGSDAKPDQSVFATEQAVAISILSRPLEANTPCRIRRGDLHGTRRSKYRKLETSTADQLATDCITPSPPFYFFAAHDDEHREEYEQGFRLPDVMPVNTTAPVTARDGLVVAFDEAELLERIAVLRDRNVSDDDVRQRFFPKPRSHRYPAGDTRGWKLPTARRRLQDDTNWQQRVRGCLYRPFDHRTIYWADWMIDWPRTDVMRHFVGHDNLGLVARRQMLPNAPCNFFWVTGAITIDGVIRSDNRGSESVFPLFLFPHDGDAAPCQVNFAPTFVEAARRALPGCPTGTGQGLEDQAESVRWIGYMYAQFFSTAYRQRYAALLRVDFPRVFLTKNLRLWQELANLGCRLLALHLGPTSRAANLVGQGRLSVSHQAANLVGSGTAAVAAGYPKFSERSVWINPDRRFEDVSPQVWEFCVGGHQVCRKWLRDRRGRELSAAEIAQYGYLVRAIEQVREIMVQIDRAIESHGGWPAAFSAGN